MSNFSTPSCLAIIHQRLHFHIFVFAVDRWADFCFEFFVIGSDTAGAILSFRSHRRLLVNHSPGNANEQAKDTTWRCVLIPNHEVQQNGQAFVDDCTHRKRCEEDKFRQDTKMPLSNNGQHTSNECKTGCRHHLTAPPTAVSNSSTHKTAQNQEKNTGRWQTVLRFRPVKVPEFAVFIPNAGQHEHGNKAE